MVRFPAEQAIADRLIGACSSAVRRPYSLPPVQRFAGRVVFLQHQEHFAIAQRIAVTLDDRQELVGPATLQRDEELPGDLHFDVGWIGHVETTLPGNDTFRAMRPAFGDTVNVGACRTSSVEAYSAACR